MTSSPDDRTDQVDDPETPPAKAAAAKKPPVKRAPAAGKTAARKPAAKTAAAKKPAVTKKPVTATAARTSAKSAAEKAAANAEVVIEPMTSKDAGDGRTEPAAPAVKKTAAAARTAAARNTTAKTATAKTTAAKTTAAKTTAAKTTAAKTTAARTAAAKAAETKSTARTAAARTASAKTVAAKTAAAKTAASKAAAAKAAADAETVVAPAEAPDASVETVLIDAPVPTPSAVIEDEAPVTATVPAVEENEAPSSVQDDVSIDETPAVPADAPRETTDTGASATERVVAEVHEVSGTPAISIRGLVKHFGDNHAVDGIDLTVPAGSFYGIVGPNGAGKTTTLSIVAGLLRADEGTVEICGIDQAAQPLAAKRVMGVLPDRLRTFDRLTGRQLLYYYGLLRGLASSVIEKRTADLARAFDLQEALSRVVSDYSAGMTKKLMLAGAMIHSPRVLVLDEPFESVDPVSSAVILDILRAYVAHGGTVILSSHGMDLVERVCSRVAIIVGGEVLAEGTIDEVRAGQTLEARFVELSGGIGEVEGLEWLHMFSD